MQFTPTNGLTDRPNEQPSASNAKQSRVQTMQTESLVHVIGLCERIQQTKFNERFSRNSSQGTDLKHGRRLRGGELVSAHDLKEWISRHASQRMNLKEWISRNGSQRMDLKEWISRNGSQDCYALWPIGQCYPCTPRLPACFYIWTCLKYWNERTIHN